MEEDEIIVNSPPGITRSSESSNTSDQRDDTDNGQFNDHIEDDLNSKTVQSLGAGRNIKHPRSYTAPSANNEELEGDLSDFGFDQKQVTTLMSKREFHFDATMQRPFHQTVEQREIERKTISGGARGRTNGVKRPAREIREGQRPTKVRKEGGEGLVVEGSGNWILFDPNAHEYPVGGGNSPPPIFRKYQRYAPGNARILEFNPISGSVRLKYTPESLQGKTIQYHPDGPRVLEDRVVVPQPRMPTQSQTQPAKRGSAAPRRKRGGRGARGGRGGPGGGSVASRAAKAAAAAAAEAAASFAFGWNNQEMATTANGRAAESVNDETKSRSTTTSTDTAGSFGMKAVKVEDDEGVNSGSESPLSDVQQSIEEWHARDGVDLQG